MEIKRNIIKYNFTKTTGRKIKYIVIHYTAGTTSNGGAALNTVKNVFGIKGNNASAHYVVDDLNVVQCVDDFNISFHCGTKGKYKHPYCRNANSLGIEICSNHDNFINYNKTPASDKGWYFTASSVKRAAELTAYLMKKHNINIGCVLRHFDVTGKDCPAPMVDENKNGSENWNNFIKLVLKFYNGITTENSDNINKTSENENKEVLSMKYHTLEEIPSWGKESIKYFIENGYLKGISNKDLDISLDLLRTLTIIYRVIKKEGGSNDS